MTKVINFYGGPSAGKSTLSAELFGYMKRQRMNVEYVQEFAKDLTWKKSMSIDDQVYILGNQHHALYTLLGQVDYIVTDSPLLLASHYVNIAMTKFNNKPLPEQISVKAIISGLAISLYRMYDNVDYFVIRGDRKFIQAGRHQNEDESRQIDGDLYTRLIDFNVSFKEVSKLEDVILDL